MEMFHVDSEEKVSNEQDQEEKAVVITRKEVSYKWQQKVKLQQSTNLNQENPGQDEIMAELLKYMGNDTQKDFTGYYTHLRTQNTGRMEQRNNTDK